MQPYSAVWTHLQSRSILFCTEYAKERGMISMEIDYEKLAIELGFSYLNGGQGKWENSGGKQFSYDAMDSTYIENCIHYIDKGIEKLNNNDCDIYRDIKRLLEKKEKQVLQSNIIEAMRQIAVILERKKEELNRYYDRRRKAIK